MKPIRRQYQLYVDRTPTAVFQFLTDLKNWPRVCPEDEPMEVLTGEDTVLEGGTRVTVRLKLGAIWQTMEMEVSEWGPPFGFATRQVKGPFAEWIHRRRVNEFQDGALMIDTIEYRPAAGPLGLLTDRFLQGPKMDAHFQFRQHEAKRLIEIVGRIKGRDAV